jgi:hypothetical protein
MASTAVYEIVVRGELDDRFSNLLEGMHVERNGGTTVLTGPAIDQARLRGLIDLLVDLRLEILSVKQTEPVLEPPSAKTP